MNFDIEYHKSTIDCGSTMFIDRLFYDYYPCLLNSICVEKNKNIEEIIAICIKIFKNKINSNCIRLVVSNSFNSMLKLYQDIVYSNLSSVNFYLIHDKKYEEFLKLEQNVESVEGFLNFNFFELSTLNNINIIEYLITKYFEFYSFTSINEHNQILEYFEFV